MKITTARLVAANACANQRDRFTALYRNGLEPTLENLVSLACADLDAWWLWHLLPAEGPGSQRAYALWCAEQVAHLVCSDPRVEQCLRVVRRRVESPESVSAEELAAAAWATWATAGAAAEDAAWAARDAAWDAARAATWATAGDAAGDAQLACLSQLLMEAK